MIFIKSSETNLSFQCWCRTLFCCGLWYWNELIINKMQCISIAFINVNLHMARQLKNGFISVLQRHLCGQGKWKNHIHIRSEKRHEVTRCKQALYDILFSKYGLGSSLSVSLGFFHFFFLQGSSLAFKLNSSVLFLTADACAFEIT